MVNQDSFRVKQIFSNYTVAFIFKNQYPCDLCLATLAVKPEGQGSRLPVHGYTGNQESMLNIPV